MHYLYIVQCSDETLYTGITKDIQSRIDQHNAGKGARYTRGRNPVRLLYSEEFETIGEALRRERQIKKWPRSKKLVLVQPQSEKGNE